VAFVANTVAHIGKSMVGDGGGLDLDLQRWREQCLGALPAMARVCVELSELDSGETHWTTPLVKKMVQFLAHGINVVADNDVTADDVTAESDKPLLAAIDSFKTSLSTALSNSKEETVFSPIFKALKADLNLRLAKNDFESWMTKSSEKCIPSMSQFICQTLLAAKGNVLSSFLNRLSVDSMKHVEFDLAFLRLIMKQKPYQRSAVKSMISRIEGTLNGISQIETDGQFESAKNSVSEIKALLEC